MSQFGIKSYSRRSATFIKEHSLDVTFCLFFGFFYGLYSLKKCCNPYGKGFQPLPPYSKNMPITVEWAEYLKQGRSLVVFGDSYWSMPTCTSGTVKRTKRRHTSAVTCDGVCQIQLRPKRIQNTNEY